MENFNNIKVTTPVSLYMEVARAKLRGRWTDGWIAAFVFMLCSLSIPNIIYSIPGSGIVNLILFFLFGILVYPPIAFGFKHISLKIGRCSEFSKKEILYGFNNMKRAVSYTLWMYLFVGLWLLLPIGIFGVIYAYAVYDYSYYLLNDMAGIILIIVLIACIPAVLANLRYDMGYFILLEHPQISPKNAIDASKQILKNNMGKLVKLYLSYIGWYLLAALVVGIVSYIGTGFRGIDSLSETGIAYNLSLIFQSGVVAMVCIYLEVGKVAMYDDLNGNIINMNSFVPKESVNPPFNSMTQPSMPLEKPGIPRQSVDGRVPENVVEHPEPEKIERPSEPREEDLVGVVKEYGHILGIGVACILIFFLSIVGSFLLHPFLIILGVIFAAMGIWAILAYKYYRVEFDKEGFTYSNIGKPKVRYSYSDISEIDTKRIDWKIRIGNYKTKTATIRLDLSHENREVFLAMAQGDYQNISLIKKEVKDKKKKDRKLGIIMLAVGIALYVVNFTLISAAEVTIYSSMFEVAALGFTVVGILGIIGLRNFKK